MFGLTRPRLAALGLLAALAAPAIACAQVLAIGDDGHVSTYSGPAVYTSDGVKSLRPALRPGAPVAPSREPPSEVARAIDESSYRHAVSVPLLRAVAWQESRFNQQAVSRKGAVGVMQLLQETAQRMGVDPSDLRGNIDGGAAYLAAMLRRFNGDLTRALAAYNAGPEAVERYGGVPPFTETQLYVRNILGRLTAPERAKRLAE